MRNKLNINDSAELAREEERISKKKAKELFENNMLEKLEPGKFVTLRRIHKFLFEDIYSFAGEIRDGNLAKGNIFQCLLYNIMLMGVCVCGCMLGRVGVIRLSCVLQLNIIYHLQKIRNLCLKIYSIVNGIRISVSILYTKTCKIRSNFK